MTDPVVERLISSRVHEMLPGITVGRVLPIAERRAVGPFVFMDHMGPMAFQEGQGMDVGAHPHIGLETVTYLFEGCILHRDSTGAVQRIEPGDVNWMTAGRGIVHTERTPPDLRRAPGALNGIQTWLALPREHEEAAPGFVHHPRHTLPFIEREGVKLHLIAGELLGARSPVRTLSETLYAELRLREGAALRLPDGPEERAVYVVQGALRVGEVDVAPGTLAVLRAGAEATLHAKGETLAMLLGGAKLDGPRSMWWNFVSSSKERIEQAKRDWTEGRFAEVPGEPERIPLPSR
ncbi:pirin family protein [Myxococcaceae bacterium GXIMD 01537]